MSKTHGRSRRDRALAATALAAAVVAVLVPGSSTGGALEQGGAADAWPQFRYDATNAGFNPAERTISRANVARLVRAWSFSPREEAGDSALSVAVSGGVVFVYTDDGALHALSVSTGRRLWRVELPADSSWTAPAVSGGRVFVFNNRYRLFALTTGGRRLWSFGFPYGVQPEAPVVADGKVYTLPEFAAALDARTGRLVWQRDDLRAYGPPAVAGGVVYAVGGPFGVAPGVQALDARTGTSRWSAPVEDLAVAEAPSLAVGARSVFVRAYSPEVSNRRQHYLLAFDRDTGKLRWRASLGHARGFHFALPAVAGNTVLYPATDGHLYAVDARTGRRRWAVAVDASASPTIANGVVYEVTNDRRLLALDLGNGRTLWSTAVGRKPHSWTTPPSAAVTGGTVYVPTNLGTVLALRIRGEGRP